MADYAKREQNRADILRIAEVVGEFETALSNISAQGPGFRMYGELALYAIRKLREANYESSAQLEPNPDEIKEMAKRAGYPLEQVLKEHGIRTEQRGDVLKD